MRNNWFAAWTAVAMAAGCAGFAAARGESSIPNYGPAPPTWSERLTAPFKKNPFAKKTAAPAKPVQEFDPISLAHQAGPGTPELYQSMAELAYRGGNVDQARQLYQKALSIDPKNLNALLSAARMEDRENRLDVAISLYDRAAKAHPKSPTALNDLSLCLARKGDLASAHRILEQAVQIEPRKALYRNNAAKVLIEMNRLDLAATHLSAVHTPAVTHYNMAVLLAERGRTAEAARAAGLALSADPQMEPAQLLLSKLNAASQAGPTQPVVQTARTPQSDVPVTIPAYANIQPSASSRPQTIVAPTVAASPANNASILPTPPTPPLVDGANAPSTPWPAIQTDAAAATPQSPPVLLPPATGQAN